MRLAWDNKFDGATIISVGSEIATLPGINVQTAHLSQKWYTQAAVNSSFLIFDLGALALDARRLRHEPDERRDLSAALLGEPGRRHRGGL
jgi:hypothetical protein